jgi:hypothetical protein
VERVRAAVLIAAAAVIAPAAIAAQPSGGAAQSVSDLIVAVHLGAVLVSDEMTVIAVGDQIYVPLEDFSRTVHFKVEWSLPRRRA